MTGEGQMHDSDRRSCTDISASRSPLDYSDRRARCVLETRRTLARIDATHRAVLARQTILLEVDLVGQVFLMLAGCGVEARLERTRGRSQPSATTTCQRVTTHRP